MEMRCYICHAPKSKKISRQYLWSLDLTANTTSIEPWISLIKQESSVFTFLDELKV